MTQCSCSETTIPSPSRKQQQQRTQKSQNIAPLKAAITATFNGAMFCLPKSIQLENTISLFSSSQLLGNVHQQ